MYTALGMRKAGSTNVLEEMNAGSVLSYSSVRPCPAICAHLGILSRKYIG